MGKLWEKDYPLDRLIEAFTVGEDYRLDRELVASDCVASIAHGDMLRAIGILTDAEFTILRDELVRIIRLNAEGNFTVSQSDEDCHTAIENHLTSSAGEAGKKIHTGRSRNDQVIAALRLYSRAFLLTFQGECLGLAESLIAFAGKHERIPMPGRTHMQIAMPSTVGLWAASFAEELVDDLLVLTSAYDLNNTCPLGSAASYGVPLPLQRDRVSDALAFRKVQNNVLYVNNSRGKVESVLLDGVGQFMLTLSKLAQDLILFSMPEFRYFTLPREICTGSSIMPQKRNPAMLELIRAKSATVIALSSQIKNIIRALPSGYNRDFQDTKGPLMQGFNITLASIRVMDLVIRKLEVNEKHLEAGFIPEIYATDRALELVADGMPFREAYREVGLHLEDLRQMDPREVNEKKSYPGAPGNLNLDACLREVKELRASLGREKKRVDSRLRDLTGIEVALFSG